MKGSVFKRGKSWSFVVDLPRDEMNQRRQKKKSGFKTKKEAEAALAQVIAEIERGDFIEPAKMTVAELLEKWLEYKSTTVRRSTWLNYENSVRKQLIPLIGHIPLNKLTAFHCQQLLTKIPEGQTKTQMIKAFKRLRDALKRAVAWGLLTKNVTDAVESPHIKNKQFRVWTFEEAAKFLAYAKENDDKYYYLYLTAITTGMRIGETVGIQWSDIDFENHILQVRRTVSWIGNKKGEYKLNDPKTNSGRRSISLPEQTVDALRKLRVRQLESKLMSGTSHVQSDFVFADASGVLPSYDNIRYHFKKLIKLIDVPEIRIHDLRHTHASLLLLQGVHPKVVAERLGHGDVSITMNTYSHLLPGLQETAAANFGNQLFKPMQA